MSEYLGFGKSPIPQTEPISPLQERNNAGGYSFTVSLEQQFLRFLILGTKNATYYVGQRALTRLNLDVLEQLIASGKGKEAVDTLVAVSVAGRAVSNDPALFALAFCAASKTPIQCSIGGLPVTCMLSAYALSHLSKVARTGTHLLHFVSYIEQFRGWGRTLKGAVQHWFDSRAVEDLAYQMLKYPSRDGWSFRDILRLSHPYAGGDDTRQALYAWCVKGTLPEGIDRLKRVWAFEKAKTESDVIIAHLVQDTHLTREMLPTASLNSKAVWAALLDSGMPLEALIRNLAKLTAVGVIEPFSAATDIIVQRLRNLTDIQKARLHPMKILAALVTYEQGHGDKGSLKWVPDRRIIDALNFAFYLSFAAVEPTGKRILLAIDTSGSMHGSKVNGLSGMYLHKACAALALVLLNTEKNSLVIGVDTSVQELPISPTQRLPDVLKLLESLGGGGTDLSLPMTYLKARGIVVDAIVILTDSETWHGRDHPVNALTTYRQCFNPLCKVVNIQMTATKYTNNHPEDTRALDVVGFDTQIPELLNAFLHDEL